MFYYIDHSTLNGGCRTYLKGVTAGVMQAYGERNNAVEWQTDTSGEDLQSWNYAAHAFDVDDIVQSASQHKQTIQYWNATNIRLGR